MYRRSMSWTRLGLVQQLLAFRTKLINFLLGLLNVLVIRNVWDAAFRSSQSLLSPKHNLFVLSSHEINENTPSSMEGGLLSFPPYCTKIAP
jgi:hypothetical protein